jgi:hypothetical protein
MSIVRLKIHVDTPIDTAVLYDTIQVWRSPDQDGIPEPFVELGAQEDERAFLDGTEEGPWNLNGLLLTVTVDGGPSKVISFSGTNPIDLATVLDQIEEIAPGLASESEEDAGTVRLMSPIYGTRSSIVITPSTAATRLGLSTSKVNGKTGYPLLAQTTEEYEFVDYDGAEDSWYKTRFYNTQTGAVSSFSTPRRGAIPDVVPASSLLRCFIYLADGTGEPIVGRRIILVPTGQVQVTNDDDQVYGVLSSVDRIILTTDDAGFAEKNLIRGQTFKVFIEGTPFQREVTIPSTGTELNLLTAASTADDPFTIVESPPMPIRMT